eukprot:TRINITY_DN17386_c0_g1_i1.p1 TRINITY_DN17386_c0_g1~~TRINITY_DN17386_c0_g1_i1.p1  ORF type:complete len:279 (-),score=65.76 TRINITY_DN17386_c0_g1_i1:213-1049(-)
MENSGLASIPISLFPPSERPTSVDVYGLIVSWTLIYAVITIAVHFVSRLISTEYCKLTGDDKINWCNRCVSGINALYVCPLLFREMWDNLDVLLADPMYARLDAIFYYGAICCGYLAYDTIFTLIFWKQVGDKLTLIHHFVSLSCMYIGVVLGLLHFFGGILTVFMEGTNPFLHMSWIMIKTKQDETFLGILNSAIFAFLFFAFRVMIASTFGVKLIGIVFEKYTLNPESIHPLVIFATALYVGLCVMSYYWFSLILRKVINKVKRSSNSSKSQKKQN